jgi:uncharacterized protein YjiS (DUF1127 family)
LNQYNLTLVYLYSPTSKDQYGAPGPGLRPARKDCTMNRLLDISAPKPQQRSLTSALGRLFSALAQSLERARTRRLLAQLNDQQLSDLGLSHSDRIAEMDKPFWR